MDAKNCNHNFESYIEKYPIILCVQTLRTPCITISDRNNGKFIATAKFAKTYSTPTITAYAWDSKALC